ncbi:MAG: cupin domain-containing protein [Gammaproteobacteria bacterium]|nr:cupin domain-containing protein [Gammaproteobacteria bacterium]
MSGTHQPGESEYRVISPEQIDWQPFAGFPNAARLAVLVGDPNQGGPFLVRVRVPAGERMMPHTHAEDHVHTVISGVFYIGLGEKFDETLLTAHAPGSVLVVPGGMAHFHWAKSGEYITQINGIGPVVLTYVDPGSDRRRY